MPDPVGCVPALHVILKGKSSPGISDLWLSAKLQLPACLGEPQAGGPWLRGDYLVSIQYLPLHNTDITVRIELGCVTLIDDGALLHLYIDVRCLGCGRCTI